jgi:hypothetical protein
MHGQLRGMLHTVSRGIEIKRHDLKSRGVRNCALVHSDNTRKTYLPIWDTLVDHVHTSFGVNNIHEISASHVISFLEALDPKRKLSPKTIGVHYAAIKKLELALSAYSHFHHHPLNFDYSPCFALLKRMIKERKGKKLPWGGNPRRYERPDELAASISSPLHRLLFRLQHQGGFRCEGVGAARDQHSKVELSLKNLKGICADPFFPGQIVGAIDQREKGGKTSRHYLPENLYIELKDWLEKNGSIRVQYSEYLSSVNQAAKDTGQFISGRGTHGGKHAFVRDFIQKGVQAGMSPEEIYAEGSKRCSHRRMSIIKKFYGR